MAKIQKYGIRDLKRDFPTDEACLDIIFNSLHNKTCSCGGTYSLLKPGIDENGKPRNQRKQYQCSKCRYQIAPTAGTIFHKSETPLTLWFYAIYLFSNAKSGLSAKQLERDLNVTYKTAWRMLMLIRKSLTQDTRKLRGDVEMDETYIGGRKRSGENNKYHQQSLAAKSVVSGAVERGGMLRAKVSPDARASTLGVFLKENVDFAGTRLITDESNRYNKIAKGYVRHSVRHRGGEYVRGDIHTNTIEGWWGHIKTSIRGTHKSISKKHLSAYLDGFAFHYNNRGNDNHRFAILLGTLLHAPRVSL